MGKKGIVIIMIALVGISLALPATSHAWGRWGWGPGAFVGGVVLGSALARPWYVPPPAYVYPPPAVVYSAPAPVYAPAPAYVYPDPAVYSQAPAPAPQGKGQWVEVPGQTVSGRWVPAHQAWVPDAQ